MLEEGEDPKIAVCDIESLQVLVLIGCDHILRRIFDRVITARRVVEQDISRRQESRSGFSLTEIGKSG